MRILMHLWCVPGAHARPWFAGLCWAYDRAAGGKAVSARALYGRVSLWPGFEHRLWSDGMKDMIGSTSFLRCGNVDL